MQHLLVKWFSRRGQLALQIGGQAAEHLPLLFDKIGDAAGGKTLSEVELDEEFQADLTSMGDWLLKPAIKFGAAGAAQAEGAAGWSAGLGFGGGFDPASGGKLFQMVIEHAGFKAEDLTQRLAVGEVAGEVVSVRGVVRLEGKETKERMFSRHLGAAGAGHRNSKTYTSERTPAMATKMTLATTGVFRGV